MKKVELVDCLKKLTNACVYIEKKAKKSGFITVDTEFVRRDTYFPKLSLIQIGTKKRAFVIDVLKFSDEELIHVANILTSEKVLKIFHSARQDCESLLHRLGIIPNPIFDTQIGLSFLGFGKSVGYDSMVDTFLNLEIDKEYQTSCWLKRPLSKEQLSYAANDVTYLFDIYKKLEKKLKKVNRLTFAFEESNYLTDKKLYEIDGFVLWEKFTFSSSQWKNAFILKHLMAWRESIAILLDKPRNHIIYDQSLFFICLNYDKDNVNEIIIESIKKYSKIAYKDIWEENDLYESINELLNKVKYMLNNVEDEERKQIKDEIKAKLNIFRNNKTNRLKNNIKRICKKCAFINNISMEIFATNSEIAIFTEGLLKTKNPWLTDSKISIGWRKDMLQRFENEFIKLL